MQPRFLFSRFAAATAAGALLTMIFVSGCHTPPAVTSSAPDHSKDTNTIPHPPGGQTNDPKDGMRHHR